MELINCKSNTMGQTTSIAEMLNSENVHYEVKKHAKSLSEIGTLTYDEFQKCLLELNEL